MVYAKYLSAIARTCGRVMFIAGYHSMTRSSKLMVASLFSSCTATGLCLVSSTGCLLASSKDNVDDVWMAEPISSVDTLKNSDEMSARVESLIMRIQGEVCRKLEELDAVGQFKVDRWERPSHGGGGITCIMSDGKVFEKAGVNVSVVKGNLTPGAMQQMRSRGKSFKDESPKYFVCGVSSVIHPRNPNVPTIHFNYRYFEVEESDGSRHWWFGGGTDLTPYFLDEADVKHFHSTLKRACDKHNKGYYDQYKRWCDTYFHIPHRGESRGVGGIFFDDLDHPSSTQAFEFVESCAEAIIPSYEPIVKKHKDDLYTYDDREWQLIRRGRYVEFNLVYDRGTKFGLMTPGARIESILMSLPKYAKWEYSHEPVRDSREAKLMAVLKTPKEWV